VSDRAAGFVYEDGILSYVDYDYLVIANTYGVRRNAFSYILARSLVSHLYIASGVRSHESSRFVDA
jgi:hypothetical protein